MDSVPESRHPKLDLSWNRWSCLIFVILIPLVATCFFLGPIGGLLRVMINAPSISQKRETRLVEFLDEIHSMNVRIL